MVIGDRIGAKERAYFKGACMEDLTACTAWFPMIEVEGRMMFLQSKDSPTGKLEAESLGEALDLAKRHRDRYRRLLMKRQANKSTENAR
ncbi:hypothetical protein [Gorillibacterium sp. sgz5001074]|uniref:hypothetical protein n=1 Tax=Gorillibacterium sp. sgz5001074 TaxID=3446695 RepID=UPI003F67EEA2